METLTHEMKQKISENLSEVVASKERQQAEKEYQKEAIQNLSDLSGLSKKELNFIAERMYKSDTEEKLKEFEEKIALCEELKGCD